MLGPNRQVTGAEFADGGNGLFAAFVSNFVGAFGKGDETFASLKIDTHDPSFVPLMEWLNSNGVARGGRSLIDAPIFFRYESWQSQESELGFEDKMAISSLRLPRWPALVFIYADGGADPSLSFLLTYMHQVGPATAIRYVQEFGIRPCTTFSMEAYWNRNGKHYWLTDDEPPSSNLLSAGESRLITPEEVNGFCETVKDSIKLT